MKKVKKKESSKKSVNTKQSQSTTGTMGMAAKYKKGGVAKKQKGGGKTISQKAAERKTSKGKGFTSSIMGPNPSGNKGAYTPFTKQGKRDAKKTGAVSNKNMKSSKKIKQKGGTSLTKPAKLKVPPKPRRINMITPEKNPKKREKRDTLMPVPPKKPLLARRGGRTIKSRTTKK